MSEPSDHWQLLRDGVVIGCGTGPVQAGPGETVREIAAPDEASVDFAERLAAVGHPPATALEHAAKLETARRFLRDVADVGIEGVPPGVDAEDYVELHVEYEATLGLDEPGTWWTLARRIVARGRAAAEAGAARRRQKLIDQKRLSAPVVPPTETELHG